MQERAECVSETPWELYRYLAIVDAAYGAALYSTLLLEELLEFISILLQHIVPMCFLLKSTQAH